MQLIYLSILALLLTACGNTSSNRYPADARKSLFDGRSFAITQRPSPQFAIVTLGRALTPLFLGMPGAHEEGQSVVTAFNIPDPKQYIGAKLIEALVVRAGAKIGQDRVDIVDAAQAESLIKAEKRTDYVLDLETRHWFISTLGLFNPTHYRVSISVTARIFDTRSGLIVSESNCFLARARVEEPPTYDELLANQGAKLKTILAGASVDCASKIQTDFLAG